MLGLTALMLLHQPQRALAEDIARKVHIVAKCWGDQDKNAHISIRWGHPHKDNNEYFHQWDIAASKEEQKDFQLSDVASEFEIQTQGGHYTGYDIRISFDGQPGLTLEYKAAPGGETKFVNEGVVYAVRSSPVNGYGEQNIRIFLNRAPNPGNIPG